MTKQSKIIILLTALLAVIVTSFLLVLLVFNNKNQFVYVNGQTGIITKEKNININNKEFETYKTTNEDVYIEFESYNMNGNFPNYLKINNDYELLVAPSTNKQNDYVVNKFKINGLNIKDSKLKIELKLGQNENGIFDTFWIKNMRLYVGDNVIKANEDLNLSYDRVIRMGHNLKSFLREDYSDSEVFNFEISSKLLKKRGSLIDSNSSEIIIKKKNKETKVLNESYIDIKTNIKDGDIISDTFILDVSFNNHIEESKLLLNGVEINNNFKFSENAWATGDNVLEILVVNKFGFIKKETINFKLSSSKILQEKLNFEAYDLGINSDKDDKLNKSKSITVVDNYNSAFSDLSSIGFSITESANKNVVWSGKSLENRTLFMEAFNVTSKKWDVVSSIIVKDEEELMTLGFTYDNNYVSSNEILVKVSSKNLTNIRLIDTYIYHATDVQYISRNGSLENKSISTNAVNAFSDMTNHILDVHEQGILEYVIMTGDFVQSTVKTGEIEWPVVMDNFINPLIENDVPIGTVSGNHDIGALNENTNEGVNTLDEFLIYDLYEQYLGDHLFNDKAYFKESFENGRSHYDQLNILGTDFIFLYLGWGSSIKGIHVSEKDINWAKQVLERYPDKNVVLSLHEYMGNKEQRTTTGNYVFEELVKPYSNIKFVFSGHVNGSSGKIDYFDDNNDGVADRKVLQLLTNFQEESLENMGATFIRRIGLDYLNNRMSFDLYSPLTNDYQIFVGNNADFVNKYTDFNYDFDLRNIGYGIITNSFGG